MNTITAPSARSVLLQRAYKQKLRPEEIQRGFEKMPQGLLDVESHLITPEEMQAMQKEFVPPQAVAAPDMRLEDIQKARAGLEQLYPQGIAGGVMNGKELGALLAKPAFTDQPDEYYLDTRITDFNEAELEELRRRINEREDFAKRYYGS